jgi:hypothetical protein
MDDRDPVPPARGKLRDSPGPGQGSRTAGRVREPAMELRFTRSRQAAGFWVVAAMCAAAALVLLTTARHRRENPDLPHPLWALLPAAAAVPAARLALHCTRHAYLILTPLGIEIFPFLRPARGMQLVPWAEIHAADFDPAAARLTLHFNPAKTAGIVLALTPIRPDRREWLYQAVQGRLTPSKPRSPAATTPADPGPAE